ncbi:acyl-CoA dehydrogenase family protein [Zwartia sp.]|uniref:acyl-CoA dehydrogenase family protein n=1 Tax=Zwartia sp. TaxID=2978004 RepID=UPI0027274C3E|nr:acyl-CoA dehydrogenase family protein [Zwartia sp.]MDO9023958.1 acyl-CoA dehydrogenase family protein [Zwartia sp.]
MTFTVKPLFGSEFQESAARFAKDADLASSAIHEASGKRSFREKKWKEAIDLGWAACLISEADGGLGGTLLDFCALLEGTAQYALPLPVSTGLGLPALLLSSLNFEGKQALLGAIADGTVRLQPIFQPLDPFMQQMSRDMTLSIQASPQGLSLNGKVSGLELVPDATHYLLCCAQADGSPSLWLLATDDVNASVSHEIRIDSRDSISISFAHQSLHLQWRLSSGDVFASAFDQMRDYGALFACVEAVSSMGAALEQTIRYLSERKQFDVTLSTFQVLRHYLADIYTKYDCFRALVSAQTRQASASGRLSARDISLLKIYLSQVGPKLAHTVIQTHGGMGMTEELWATRLNKRILMTNLEYGDGQYHTERAYTLTKAEEQHA